jgi:hypothetical protein
MIGMQRQSALEEPDAGLALPGPESQHPQQLQSIEATWIELKSAPIALRGLLELMGLLEVQTLLHEVSQAFGCRRFHE